MDEAQKEINKIYGQLIPEIQRDMQAFINHFEDMSGLFGCPDLWLIFGQAFLLHTGHKLKHCKHKTAESLLGCTADTLGKLHTKLREKKDE